MFSHGCIIVSERTNKSKKERASTGSGPSPPRVHNASKITTQLLATPTLDQNGQSRHDMAVGPSPPRETRAMNHSMVVGTSPTRETRTNHNSASETPSSDRREPLRVPYGNTQQPVERHSVSVGPSPPRGNTKQESGTGQKKFAGTSPPRDVPTESRSSIAGKTNMSNTGTSPPPQSISTQVNQMYVGCPVNRGSRVVWGGMFDEVSS